MIVEGSIFKVMKMLFLRLFPAVYAFLLLISASSTAQEPKRYTASEIHHEIQKLNFLGTALFIAAHPDDENTRLIAHLANEVKARTAYLSITRGDGGQNLIGPELRESLGVLRTQELLAARGLDGGEQWFTRGNDFGFSKHPDETFTLWDKEAVMHDVIWAIRKIRPDVIVNRFDHRSPGTTHGHHTASAMLSHEAFALTNDPSVFPEQLTATQVWQPKRLFFNTSWWFYGSREKFKNADKSNMLQLDVGTYYPNLGISNNEIASMARSQHKCQGFGQLLSRGAQPEYLEFLLGDKPENGTGIFGGINTTWTRVVGGEAIGIILNAIERDFDFTNPSRHIPDLVKAYELLQNIDDEHWKTVKSEQLKNIILACGGMYLEASSKTPSAVTGEAVTLQVEALNRSAVPMELKSITVTGTTTTWESSTPLDQNFKKNIELEVTIPTKTNNTTPYWLEEKGSLGMYTVTKKEWIGKAETPSPFKAIFQVNIAGTDFSFTKPIVHRYSKPEIGEIYEPFNILPKVTSSFEEEVFLFNTQQALTVNLSVRAGAADIQGTASLNIPKGWSTTPKQQTFSIAQKGEYQTLAFKIVPPENENIGTITPTLTIDGATFGDQLIEINYAHIPKQSMLLPAKAKVVRMNIQKDGENIGYIVGAGDRVPESLEQIGYKVEVLQVDTITPEQLAKFDGIVLGIRAYNILESLKYKQPMLLDYVKQGGNMIVQYNTANRWRAQFENIAPFPLTISRDRVTDENAAVNILAPKHPLINEPNKIEAQDFRGWVQERGLYFPNEWAPEFTAILSMADKGENQKEGSLLVAPYGNGNYIYTGLSFFRELPAGVPGAYKLFANMLSLKKRQDPQYNETKG
ncbi:MAG: PIG-L family deacetylase [Bacteroidota bacterium]